MSILARVVKILAIEPIPNADKIELARVLGWQVVVKKDECKVDGLAIYVNIGTKLDENNKLFEFLNGKTIKTRKIRGVISQGIIFSMSILTGFGVDPATLNEGDDVSAIIKAEKWIPEEELDLYDTADPDRVKFPFPPMIPKTDEERVQNIVKKLSKLKGLRVVVTQKFDGTSFTVALVGDKFMVCGRNFLFLEETVDSYKYFEIVRRYGLEEKLRKLGRNIAIQCEIIGPKISGNRHQVDKNDVFVFNIYDVDAGEYLDWDEILAITTELGLKTVTCIYRGEMKEEWMDKLKDGTNQDEPEDKPEDNPEDKPDDKPENRIKVPNQNKPEYEWRGSDNLLKLAEEQFYSDGVIAEGIVIKSDSRTYPFRFSCKAISNKYLLKYNL